MSSSNNSQSNKDKIDEALRSALNTVAIIAVLIASVSFTAGISPPGTSMEVKGTSVVGQTTAFKIFIISNAIALFSSLVIVVVLVSIIPIEEDNSQDKAPDKALLGYFKVVHHAVCVSVAFMAVAYVAAMWIIIPRTGSPKWIIVLISVIGGVGGTIVIILIVLGKVVLIYLKIQNAAVQNKIK